MIPDRARMARAALQETDRFLAEQVEGPDDARHFGRYFAEIAARGEPTVSTIPKTAFRDLSVATAGAGGYLVPTGKLRWLDLLRGRSIATAVGATFVEIDKPCTLPEVTDGVAAAWLTAEAVQITAGQPTLKEVAIVPKHAGLYTVASRQFMMQVDAAGEFIGSQLLAAFGVLLDAGMISGSGANGQPTGVVNLSGVSTQSGTTLGHAGVRTMRRKCIEAGADEANLAWIGGAAAQDVLGGRALESGGGRFCWDTDGVLGRPAHATKRCTTDTLVVGDFSRCLIAIFGETLKVEVNPYANFQAGKVAARLLVDCDVAFGTPASFVVSTSIT
jgi:HK97 family phage major capsid protein